MERIDSINSRLCAVLFGSAPLNTNAFKSFTHSKSVNIHGAFVDYFFNFFLLNKSDFKMKSILKISIVK